MQTEIPIYIKDKTKFEQLVSHKLRLSLIPAPDYSNFSLIRNLVSLIGWVERDGVGIEL